MLKVNTQNRVPVLIGSNIFIAFDHKVPMLLVVRHDLDAPSLTDVACGFFFWKRMYRNENIYVNGSVVLESGGERITDPLKSSQEVQTGFLQVA